MNSIYIIIAVVLILAIVGFILAPIFARRKRSERFHDLFGSEYDSAVQRLGNEKEAQAELDERRKHVETLNIRPLSMNEREHYLADWKDVQFKFIDDPGQAIVNADRLIMEVMQVRAYPISGFEQRSADVSISYPALVNNYRSAQEIALKNEHQQADNEELRQAMIYYRSLFDELIQTKAKAVIER